jgi:ABC-type transport system involved in multi-copper enzyme maturation permease subunit
VLGAFRGELFKTIKRPAVWASIGILLALAIALGYAISWFLFTHPPSGATQNQGRGAPTFEQLKVILYPANVVKQTLNQWATLGGVFALILGVLSQGSEYGWGTVKTLLTQRPGRLAVLGGKVLTLALTVLVTVALLFAVDSAASYVIAIIDGKSTDFPPLIDLEKGLLAAWLIFGFWALFGFTLATLFRQSAMAIGLGLAYAILIEGIILNVLGSVGGDFVKQIQQWFPIANTGYLVQSFGQSVRAQGAPVTKPFADANHAVAVLFVYLAVFLVASAYLVKQRDVT